MTSRTVINIYKNGQKQFTGVKVITILAETIEHVIDKNTTPLRFPQRDEPDPKTRTLDLRIPPTITYEITGYLANIHQVLITNSVSSGNSIVIPVTTAAGFEVNDTITIASPDNAIYETTTITNVDTANNTITADLSNNYPTNSLISKTLNSNPKADLIAIIKDLGVANLVYGSETIHIQFNKASIKETPSSKEQDEMYEVKLSVFETEDLK